MPGRLAVYDDNSFKKDITSIFPIFNDRIITLNPSFNTPPTSPIPTLLNNADYIYTHFGLIPSWAKDKSAMQVNARNENLFERVSFTESFRFRRCLIIINGWYEWKDDTGAKQPYYIYSKDHDYLALAGVWDSWTDPKSGQIITSSAIITCEPNDLIKSIHHRMPVILPRSRWQAWLNPQSDIQNIYKTLIPLEDDQLAMHRVSSEVNSVKFNTKQCIIHTINAPTGQGLLF